MLIMLTAITFGQKPSVAVNSISCTDLESGSLIDSIEFEITFPYIMENQLIATMITGTNQYDSIVREPIGTTIFFINNHKIDSCMIFMINEDTEESGLIQDESVTITGNLSVLWRFGIKEYDLKSVRSLKLIFGLNCGSEEYEYSFSELFCP